ncbi:hypothetical protein [Amycolatopsis methanolica]|uniref:hypothetical protein n=1 Tax=Amycolatopsis methanolica TaxID=1814 RepID=UPI003420C0F2
MTNVQEQVTSAVQAIQAALAQLEAAGASAHNLEATLTRHQQTVGEAYAASPDAGDRQFVTTE